MSSVIISNDNDFGDLSGLVFRKFERLVVNNMNLPLTKPEYDEGNADGKTTVVGEPLHRQDFAEEVGD